ncbi:hypothetical protein BDW42DRAFT_188769 [Aspergillus taichungensis]|uniref:Uncharacterized protein n=1 Tax=Aspergillus taichungensis TaxID=482145 RepID=A0A2J5HH30_9EURO|nr:hypothetical protein BDW42DRAFT_188769 [Aspergillus taichungensis]
MGESENYPRYEDYAIAWLCALPVEMAAAEAMLDQRHPDLPTKHHDSNTYVLGRVQYHNVVIACLPCGVYGTVSAARIATEIRFTFPSIQFGLMVGIGGGVPGPQTNIRLGDVVVSKPSREFGGVVQYDSGKLLESRHFVRTGVLNKPPTVLLTAISRLQAAHMLRGNGLSDLVCSTLNMYPLMKETFQCPEKRKDENPECLDWQAFSETSPKRKDNVDLEKTNKPIAVHYGLIASGDKVMKDDKLRDQLAREYGFLCFEMEAAGLMDNFPCLVIRGISDYADSAKCKDWQGYASLTAAAYTRELLSSVHVNQISENLKEFQIDEALLSQITSYDHEKVHQRLAQKRLMGTTQWFLQSPDFQLWISGKATPFLWCSGKIGSGKTIIATAVVEEARLRSSKVKVATVFFYFDEQQVNDQRSLVLSSFIKQLCEFLIRTSVPLPPEVEEILRRHFGPSRQIPDLEDFKSLFTHLFYLVPNAIYVLDGLDSLEQDHVKSLLTYFGSLFRKPGRSPLHSRALFLSRDHLAGNTTVSMFFTNIPRISTSGNVTEDIRIYIEDSIAEKMVFNKLTMDDSLVMDMKSVLTRESSGMFLWVFLQIEILWDTCVSDAEIQHALTALPKDLEETYRRCVQRMNLQDPRILRALIWTRFAAKSLHIEELQEAVAFSVYDTSWERQRIPRSDFVIGSCANLLVLDSSDNHVRFAHTSISQFLDNNRDYIPGCCGELCIAYLSFSDFSLQLDRPTTQTAKTFLPEPSWLLATLSGSQIIKNLFPVSKDQTHSVSLPLRFIHASLARPREQYKFLHYATQHWTRHTKSITSGSGLYNKFTRLALTINDSWNIHPWTSGGRSHLSHIHALFGWAVKECHQPLLLLVLGLNNVTQHIVNIPLLGFHDIGSVEDLTPLHYAAMRGHLRIVCELLQSGETVELLLVHGAEIEHKGIGSLSPLASAARMGRVAVVHLLIQKGAFLEDVDDKGRTPLIRAAEQGHEETTRVLLAHGADHNASDDEGRTALIAATQYGRLKIAKLLVEHKECKPHCRWIPQRGTRQIPGTT